MTTAMPDRLHRTGDVRAVFEGGTASQGRHVVVRARARIDEGAARFTVAAGRKVGSAVARNRAKRRLRSAVRSEGLPAGWDIVVVARRSTVEAGFGELRRDVSARVEHATRRGRERAG